VSDPASPAPGTPASQPQYAPPAGYVPSPGFTAPATPPVPVPTPGARSIGGHAPAPRTAAPVRRGPALGRIALVLALIATVGAALVSAAASFNIGLGTGRELAGRPIDADFDWSILTPVRDWVLAGEAAFWVGTVLGVWALVQGVVAIVTHRGRGTGIAAVAIAALGPLVFALVTQGFLIAGFSAGSGVGG